VSGARGFTRFVGVSLGGGRGKTTAIARLEVASRTAESEADDEVRLVEARVRHGHRGSGEDSDAAGDPLFRDEVLVAYLERHVDEATAVAINAPLTLPPCIRCTLPCPGVAACTVPVVGWMRRHAPGLSGRRGRTDPGKPAVTPYTQRAADLLLAHAGLQPRESLGQGMGPLAARAAYLRRVLSPRLRLHENLIEVHPPATLIRLAGEAVVRRLGVGPADEAWELRRRVLGELRPRLQFDYVWPDIVVRSPHVFEAVIAAYTAFLWSSQGWQGPGDVRPTTGKTDKTDKVVVVRDPLEAALDELGGLWLADGWIWVPPVQTRGGAASSP
jgi:predicted nuclease with RNAse H fold